MAEHWTLKGERADACVCNTPCGCVMGQDPTKDGAEVSVFELAGPSLQTDLAPTDPCPTQAQPVEWDYLWDLGGTRNGQNPRCDGRRGTRGDR